MKKTNTQSRGSAKNRRSSRQKRKISRVSFIAIQKRLLPFVRHFFSQPSTRAKIQRVIAKSLGISENRPRSKRRKQHSRRKS